MDKELAIELIEALLLIVMMIAFRPLLVAARDREQQYWEDHP